ncbi:MAG: hypothetical protein JXI32_03755 [Deltaproteobacteria bacterium]|nr:hypothetical protein [Deltaproteobacteria bacterium]
MAWKNLYRGLFNQSGIIRVEAYEDLRDCATPLLRYPLPRGNCLGVIAFSGAIGIPFFSTTRKTVRSLGYMVRYSSWRRSMIEEPG